MNKQLPLLLLLIVLLVYRPQSYFGMIVSVVIAIAVIVMNVSLIKEHRKKTKKD